MVEKGDNRKVVYKVLFPEDDDEEEEEDEGVAKVGIKIKDISSLPLARTFFLRRTQFFNAVFLSLLVRRSIPRITRRCWTWKEEVAPSRSEHICHRTSFPNPPWPRSCLSGEEEMTGQSQAI